MTDTPNSTARTFAGYYRELVASGLPRGLAQSLVATAAANDRRPLVHPDALAAVDSTRDKALGRWERAEGMARHPAGKQNPAHPDTRSPFRCRTTPVFDEWSHWWVDGNGDLNRTTTCRGVVEP
ncbi:hypothetical protein ACWFMI_25235 [Nocardiopsis terrae]|uniref:hypothetical protein n=1 Tax=Streptomyces sp. NPDC057554 TaxID=3350538 RepID=UPI0036C083B5